MTDSHFVYNQQYWKTIYLIYAAVGFTFNLVEITSYIILYHFISVHNNQNTVMILEPSVIRMRNRSNAISLTGLFAGWTMEVWYVILLGFMTQILDSTFLREVPTVLKYYEFFLIPLVETHSSPPIIKFIQSSNLDGKISAN